MNIVLIGYRGSGKTSVGKRLATLLSMPFVDTDTLIVERAGKTIRDIFETPGDTGGETGFRTLESAVIRDVALRDNQVIALGGGAILKPENLAALKQGNRAKVIWLKASPEVLYQRIQADTATNQTRPNLTASGGLEEVQKLLAFRTPLYQAAADVTYDVTGLSIDASATELLTLI